MLGKVLLNAKRMGDAVSEYAKEAGVVLKDTMRETASDTTEVMSEISGQVKISFKIQVLSAEMDELYLDLGKAVFENGLTPDNAEALGILEVLNDKKSELATLKKAQEEFYSCDEPCSCDCKDIPNCNPSESAPENKSSDSAE